MKKISSGMACFMLFSIVFFSSCAKEGPAGAAGPAGAGGAPGAPGAPGAGGPAGPAGAAGTVGTANVIYSDWLDVAFTPTRNTAGDTTGFTASIPAAKLTADLLSKGEIKVYLNGSTLATPNVFPLPYFDGSDIISVSFRVGIISLSATDDFGTFPTANGKALQYRYILIPGATTARSMSNPATAIDWNDYSQVKKYLHLND